MSESVQPVCLWRLGADGGGQAEDVVAVEAPLEIRLEYRALRRTIGLTMRTPGDDEELVAGYLFTEGILMERSDLAFVERCEGEQAVRVGLAAGVAPKLTHLERLAITSSSCGVCGKTSLDAIASQPAFVPFDGGLRVASEVLYGLPGALRAGQSAFEATGGAHSSGLFSASGELACLREDVGRHNALDKVVGWAFLNGLLPLRESVLLVSGRASFELVQKAAMAGIPFLAAIGAPSSLAVQLAESYGMTLVGFLKQNSANVYCGLERLAQ